MVAIPAALVMILVEKLVAMIVPAVGALMTIIEGLQAAWGTISRIIAAFAAFMAFLLAVKSGGAGPLFATVLASAAVVVLDFVANWLLKKLASAARKVGAKLKGLAEKFKSKRKAKKDAKAGKHHDEHDGASSKKHHDDEHDGASPKKHHDDEHDGASPKKHHDDEHDGAPKKHHDEHDGPNAKKSNDPKKKAEEEHKKEKELREKKEQLKKAKRAVRARLRAPHRRAEALQIAEGIAGRFGVTATLRGAGSHPVIHLRINPEDDVQLEEEKAKTKAQAEMGRAANAAGNARNDAMRAANLAREAAGEGTSLPAGSDTGAGLDAAMHLPELDGGKGNGTVEIQEGKKGSYRLLRQVRGSRSVPETATPFPVASSADATHKLGNDEAVRGQVIGGGDGKGAVFERQRADGSVRILRLELSSITSHLKNSVERMYAAIEAAVATGELEPSVERAVKNILAGKGGTIKVVLDVDRLPQRLSVETRDATIKLIEQAINTLLFKVEEVQTKIEIVMRRKFDTSTDKDVRAL